MTNNSVNNPGSNQPRLSIWPGERLGLPKEGPGSIARLGVRVLAVLIDWGIAMLIALLFTSFDSPNYNAIVPLVFLGCQILVIPLLSGSIGHRICGMHLATLNHSWVGVWRPVVRSVLLVLVLPALVFNSDQRGFHDICAGTVLVRTKR